MRTYHAEELVALRAVTKQEWPGSGDPAERGPAQFASGDYWPTELRRRAVEFDRLATNYRIAADALEREIEGDAARVALQAGGETS
jgi:hypothetical protein